MMTRLLSIFIFLSFISAFAADISFAGSTGARKINRVFRDVVNQSRYNAVSSGDSKKAANAVSKGSGAGMETPRTGGALPDIVDKSHIKRSKYAKNKSSAKRNSAAQLAGASPTDARYDLRDTGYLSEIRNQNPENDCWAFATFSSMETNLHKKGDFYKGSQKYDFYEYKMAGSHGFDYTIDEGGTSDIAAAYLAHWAGPVWENTQAPVLKHLQGKYDLPYPDRSYYGASYAANGGAHQDSDFIRNIKEALLDYGPVYVSISSQNRFWNNNNKDFYAYDCTAPFGRSLSDGTNGSCSSDGHAVSVIGWDDNYPKTNFGHTPPGNGAFIVRNSWGSGVGEGGYFYLSYYDSSISQPAVFDTPENADNYEKQYSYDLFGHTVSAGCEDFETGCSSNIAWAANLFTAENDGFLKAVSFFTTDSDVNATVYIYTGVNNNLPRSGTEYQIFNGPFEYAGYHTVKVPNNIQILLKKNKVFSVVIKFENTTGTTLPLATEYRFPDYTSQATAEHNQSFYSRSGPKNAGWTDITYVSQAKTYEFATDVYDKNLKKWRYDVCQNNFDAYGDYGKPVTVGNEKRCYYDFSKANFPIKAFTDEDETAPYWPDNAEVRDGTGQDISVTDNETSLSANWDAALDNEVGISGYMVAISTDKGASSYILNWKDAGNVRKYTANNLSLEFNKIYYFGVKAYNMFGTLSEAKWSSGQRLWFKKPAKPSFVNDGYYDKDTSGSEDDDYIRNTGTLAVHWGASVMTDPSTQSAVDHYEYAIGTSRGGTDVSKGWLSHPVSGAPSIHIKNSTDASGASLVLGNDKTYYYTVVAVDANGKRSDMVISDGQTIDETEPKISFVTMAEKVSYGTFNGTFTMNKPYAALKNIPEVYFLAANGKRGNIEVSNIDPLRWQFSGTVINGTHATGTAVLYFSATSKSGITGTEIESGKSFIISSIISDDQTPPSWINPAVRDGLTDTDIGSTPSNTSLSANWNPAVDYESGIKEYQYRIGTVKYGSDVFPDDGGWVSAGTQTYVTAENLELSYGSTYYFTVRAVNQAGLSSTEIASNGQWIDESKPGNIAFVTCSWENTPIEYANWQSTFTAKWTASEDFAGEEKAAIGYRYALGTSAGATDTSGGWKQQAGNVTQAKIEGLSLLNEKTYYFSVKAYNKLNRESNVNVCSIYIDRTPPKIEEITLETAPQNTGSSIKGYFKMSEVSGRLKDVPSLSFENSHGVKYPLSVSIHTEGEGYFWDFSGFVDSTEGMEGNAHFVLAANDKAGNLGTGIMSGGNFTINALRNNQTSSSEFKNSDGCRVVVPRGTVSGDVKITITEADDGLANEADNNSPESTPLRSVYLPRDFKAYDSAGDNIPSFSKSVRITFPYPDADGDGKTDGDYFDVDSLFIHHLDESSKTWIPLPNTVRNREAREISAEVNHFSIYSLRSVTSNNLSFKVIPAPNPCHFTRNVLKLQNIPVDAAGVKAYIYNSAGELVRQLGDMSCISGNCSIVWDGRTKNGLKAASGVYVYLIKTENRGKARGKFYAIW